MRLCSATTKAGKPCQRPAQAHNGLCLGHDPDKAAERRRTASRGGRGRVNTETRAVKKLMDDLTRKVLAGEVEPAVSHAVVALQNVRAEFEELKRELGIS